MSGIFLCTQQTRNILPYRVHFQNYPEGEDLFEEPTHSHRRHQARIITRTTNGKTNNQTQGNRLVSHTPHKDKQTLLARLVCDEEEEEARCVVDICLALPLSIAVTPRCFRTSLRASLQLRRRKCTRSWEKSGGCTLVYTMWRSMATLRNTVWAKYMRTMMCGGLGAPYRKWINAVRIVVEAKSNWTQSCENFKGIYRLKCDV